MLTTGPRGTRDVLPGESGFWQYVEAVARDTCRRFAYREIRTPIFEHTELFLRGIGETTDIVEKEMYTFCDRGNRSLTLRPENTAAVVRSFLEHKLYSEPMPVKLYYIGPMFRYDRPQAGRYRQFHQFGIEAIGAKGPAIDAEVIVLAEEFLHTLGLRDLDLKINTVGCPACRPQYRQALREYLAGKLEHLCQDCRTRYERNPLRVLDCKEEQCSRQITDAPKVVDHLCRDCAEHFAGLQELLTAAGVKYELAPRLVRGLDYYTNTAFEIQYPPLGAQSAVCGGGRYDGLIEECGGVPTPGIGFAIGLERVILALEKQNLLPASDLAVDVFFAPLGAAALPAAFRLLTRLRAAGLVCEMDFLGRSLKGQLKHAARCQAKYVAILGENELTAGKILLRDMRTGEQRLVDLLEGENSLLAEVRA